MLRTCAVSRVLSSYIHVVARSRQCSSWCWCVHIMWLTEEMIIRYRSLCKRYKKKRKRYRGWKLLFFNCRMVKKKLERMILWAMWRIIWGGRVLMDWFCLWLLQKILKIIWRIIVPLSRCFLSILIQIIIRWTFFFAFLTLSIALISKENIRTCLRIIYSDFLINFIRYFI